MSGLGALDSLATYTDSDEELEKDVEEESQQPAASVVVPQPTEAVNSNSNASSLLEAGNRESVAAANLSGLVSYHLDDQIDDEAVDDYQSDSLSEKDEELKRKSGDDESQSPLAQPQRAPEVIDVEDDGNKIKLPPEPPGPPDQKLVDKVNKLYSTKMTQGLDMNAHIYRNKQFRNPSIYEKLITLCDIDELGTNYPSEIYNPHEWKESAFYDELAKIQKADMERREKEKKERTKVEFISGTVKKPISVTAPQLPNLSLVSNPVDSDSKRKSKWDQRGSITALAHNLQGAQPSLMQPNLATAATGTKSTVINAFGNLPKKPKQ